METYYRQQLACLCKNIHPADPASMDAARRHWDGIAKPLEGLGQFEKMITKIAGIQKTEAVSLERKAVVVFCADNGVVAEGVTQTDSSVTAVVTENFAKGIASVNRMAAVAGADVLPVDMGVAGEIREPGVRNCKIARGTANLRREPAMSEEQALEAIHTGIALAGELKDAGYDLLAVGEMGIGNTTTSSALASVLLGQPVEAVTGRGAGLSGDGLQRKIQVIEDAIRLHQPDASRPLPALAALGGFDIAGMTGLLLGGAIYGIPVVLDGMISAVAALLAQAFCPQVTDYILPSHLGKEPACRLAMEKLGLEPVIYGALALGEGTGAVMLFPLLEMAYTVYLENSTFAEIQIDAYEKLQ
ncbi:MAG: nicotinate-nucleotide--dimethylbenzimidazole phosphoribosyltransferase [Lachnospiraceae bacterium]|nr:nicotinate-nucleotide--dimethylbenzimidazole phosphoribosyltransferase [Lachnospiraceae bacterium]